MVHMAKKKAKKTKQSNTTTSKLFKLRGGASLGPIKILSGRGSVLTFTANLVHHPDPAGMGMDSWDVNVLLVLDFDSTVEVVDPMQAPFIEVPNEAPVELTVVNNTNGKNYSGSIVNLTAEPANCKVTIQFKPHPVTETVVF